jgi:hypothetical protein
MEEPLGKANYQYAHPVNRALEQDRLYQWRAVETAHEWQIIRYQHCFSDEQRRYRRSKKAREIDAILLQYHAFGPEDQIETDEEENRRR